MRFKVGSFLAIVALFVMAASLLAQGSDPLSGTWTGDWGPSAADRNDVTMQLKYDGKVVTGAITSGRNVTKEIPLEKASFDSKTGAFKAEASVASRGAQVHYVIEGKVEKNSMSGSWNHDNRKGDFKLTKK